MIECSHRDPTLQQVELVDKLCPQATGLIWNNSDNTLTFVLYTTPHPQRGEYLHFQLLDTSNIVRLVVPPCSSIMYAGSNKIVHYNGLNATIIRCLQSKLPTYLHGALRVLSYLDEEHIIYQGASGSLDFFAPKITHFHYRQNDAPHVTGPVTSTI